MKNYRMRCGKQILCAALSIILALTGTGCSAEEIVQKLQDLKIRPKQEQADEDSGENEAAANGSTSTESAAVVEPGSEQLTPEEERRRSEGKVLNIYCWDESLEDLFLQYYPGYEDVGDRVGKIGDTTVNWVIPEDGKKYMDLLAERLLTAEYLDKDDRVDLYLAPEEDLAIYVNSDYSLDVREKLGLTDEELEDQFPFTQQMATTDDGVLKAVAWQASPGVFIYRRSIAKQVFGTDNPDAVQKELEDWKSFNQTAVTMKKNKYYMVSG